MHPSYSYLLFLLKPISYNLQPNFMAITKSAKKAIRASSRKRAFNLRRKEALHDAAKSLLKALSKKDVAGAEKLLPIAYKTIDKAMKRGVIKKNTAARKKSRLALAIKRTKTK
jgi:small subunit ribosomal protein S20